MRTLAHLPLVFIDHRKEDRELLALSYDRKASTYTSQVLEHDVGPANVFCHKKDGQYRLAAANRETDEIAFYDIEKS